MILPMVGLADDLTALPEAQPLTEQIESEQADLAVQLPSEQSVYAVTGLDDGERRAAVEWSEPATPRGGQETGGQAAGDQDVTDGFDEAIATSDEATVGLGTLMVDLSYTSSDANSSQKVPTLVKGAEDGRRAIALKQWLIPLDDATKVLGLKQTLQTDGRLELRSAEVATHINLESLQNDPELGLVWSIAEIEGQLGTAAEFDREQYTLYFNQSAVQQPALEHNATRSAATYSDSAYDSAHTYLAEVASAEATAEVAPVDTETPIDTETVDTDFPIVSAEAASEVLAEDALGVLLVGLAIDDMTTVEATLVKGREDGVGAIAFDRWLIPFEDAIAALGASVTPQPDGLVAVRAPGLAIAMDLSQLQIDPDLGSVISIADIQEKFGIAAEFSFSQYAINFLPPVDARPVSARRRFKGDRSGEPIVTAGLPRVAPTTVSLSGLRQATRTNSASDGSLSDPTGELSAVGSVFGGSWYAQFAQPSIHSLETWQLKELQYFRQSRFSTASADVSSRNADYVLGSQPTFWRSMGQPSAVGDTYWGATTVQRWGFTPPNLSARDGFDARARMQSHQIGRTISGEADPGTFVQLTQGLNGPVVAETIVDSAGVYRFEDVPATGQLGSVYSAYPDADRSYQVQLYANGQLTSPPDIRRANFTTLPGQLPDGASALMASAGMGHRLRSGQMLGDFSTFRGGIAYRRGLSESLTMGAGFVQDGSPQVLTEAFYLPEGVPLQAAFSAQVDMNTGQTRVDANVRYLPVRNLKLTFDSDRFSQRFDANWKLSPHITLTAAGNSRSRSLLVGASATYRTGNWIGSANAAIDTRQNFRWRLSAVNRRLALSHQGSEVFTYSEVSYRLPDRKPGLAVSPLGHQIVLSYETRKLAFGGFGFENEQITLPTGRLATAQWRYASPRRRFNGQSAWNCSVGYGVGAYGSGPIATLSAALGQGFDLQMRYQGVSAFSARDSFQLSLVSRLNTQNGFGWGDRQQDRLRTRGGLFIQPFLDNNGNGIRDASEPLSLEDPDLLLQLNHESLRQYRASVQSDGILLTVAPDTYRLDIDPAGLPLDRTVGELAYAIEVVAGQYTAVAVPLAIAYTVSGVVVDNEGNGIAGARVEAISASGHRQISVTNQAGVYYLERLQPERYDIEVNGTLLEREALQLEEEANPFLERELHLL